MLKHKKPSTTAICKVCLCVLLMLSPVLPAQADSVLRHEMIIEINAKDSTMQVEDSVTLPDGAQAREWRFFLHDGMEPTVTTEGARLTRGSGKAPKSITDAGVAVTAYSVTLPAGMVGFTLRYQGKIDHPIDKKKGTVGVIAEDGLYLSPESCWYPRFDVDLISFRMDVKVPDTWQAITQGERISLKRFGDSLVFRWDAPDPLEDMVLIGGPYIQMVSATPIRSYIFLRKTADIPMEAKYLLASNLLLGTYSKWFGAYPYKTMAIVENFWENSLNRQSLLLLGPKAIRSPSTQIDTLPSEILRNWWGSSVYLDPSKGDWSQGLIAYLAEHHRLDKKGQAAEYRRAALQRYTSYISAEADFPIAAYRTHEDANDNAIGKDKAVIFYHMLRQKLGDKAFLEGFNQFYEQYKFRHANFDQLVQSLEKSSGLNLQPDYERWIKQPGAPRLQTSAVSANQQEGEGYLLKAAIEQQQNGPAYTLNIPLAVYLEGQEEAYQTTVEMTSKRLELSLPVPGRPLAFGVDPEYDLLRLLDITEMPPLWSKALNAKNTLVVLPSAASAELLEQYRKLADMIQKQRRDQTEIKLDNELADLPAESSVVILGWENTLRSRMTDALAGYDGGASESSARIAKSTYLRNKHGVLLVGKHPSSNELAVAWIANDNVKAFAGMIEQLPDGGPYSYLAFEGDEAKNIAQGTWEGARQTFKVLPATKASSKKVKFRLKPRYELGQ